MWYTPNPASVDGHGSPGGDPKLPHGSRCTNYTPQLPKASNGRSGDLARRMCPQGPRQQRQSVGPAKGPTRSTMFPSPKATKKSIKNASVRTINTSSRGHLKVATSARDSVSMAEPNCQGLGLPTDPFLKLQNSGGGSKYPISDHGSQPPEV